MSIFRSGNALLKAPTNSLKTEFSHPEEPIAIEDLNSLHMLHIVDLNWYSNFILKSQMADNPRSATLVCIIA